MKSLLLNKDTWDLELDANGNIAITESSYTVAQNVSNAVRLFTKDAYFNQEDGIPHFQLELGLQPVEASVREEINTTALGVDGVVNAETTFTKYEERNLEGVITLTTIYGDTVNVQL